MGSRNRPIRNQDISQKQRAIGGDAGSPGVQPPPPGAEVETEPQEQGATRAANETITEWNRDHLEKLADDFDAAIEECAAGAGVKPVHQVRTGSRRVQATIESMLRTAGAAGRLVEPPAKAWLRSIKSLRRAAGPVRDLDVHRKLLQKAIEQWEQTDSKADSIRPFGAPAELASEARKLDEWLKSNRHARAEMLKKKIKKNHEKLRERRGAFQMALQKMPSLPLASRRSSGEIALDDFVRIVDRMPSLDAGNLHEFRKQVKKARYVAESQAEASSRAVAGALKRLQDAIGDWHDREILAQEGKTALAKDREGFLAWLQQQADGSLTAALRTAGNVRGQLLGEWMAAKRGRSTNRTLRRKAPGRESEKSRPAAREISGAA